MNIFRESLPVINSKVRILHAVPKAPKVDVYINGQKIAEALEFSKITNYFVINPGSFEMQIYNSGTYVTPLLSQKIEISPTANYTFCIVTLQGSLYIFRLKDDNVPSTKLTSFLRFINLSANAPLVSLALPNDVVLFNGAEYLETTGYYQLSSGIYNFKFLFDSATSTAKFIKNLTLDNGNFYTIYIIGVYNSKPPLGYLFVEDSKD